MAAFTTHPSVRIKGTENNYDPVLCSHPKCVDRPPHMHCPFCVKTDTYPDPVILKAHYRVKHVDKGLDFAGLKILRCCDHCDIVGAIKGEKKFKGPHWHCYRCRNGFNRRDEAVKHYKTHFRNPQTTFQIQVAQEVNIMLNNMNSLESSEAVDNIGDHSNQEFTMHGHLGETIHVSGHHLSNGYNPYSTQKNNDTNVQVAANETVDATDSQTIMIIQDPSGAQPDYGDPNLIQSTALAQEDLFQQKCNLMRHVEQLQAENDQLKSHNQLLSEKIEQLNEELQGYKAVAGVKHAERVDKLIDELASKHKQLLYEQLVRIRMEQSASQQDLNVVAIPNTVIPRDDTCSLEEQPATKKAKIKDNMSST